MLVVVGSQQLDLLSVSGVGDELAGRIAIMTSPAGGHVFYLRSIRSNINVGVSLHSSECQYGCTSDCVPNSY